MRYPKMHFDECGRPHLLQLTDKVALCQDGTLLRKQGIFWKWTGDYRVSDELQRVFDHFRAPQAPQAPPADIVTDALVDETDDHQHKLGAPYKMLNPYWALDRQGDLWFKNERGEWDVLLNPGEATLYIRRSLLNGEDQ